MLRRTNRVEDLQKRLQQSERDKCQLRKSIQQLNECYLNKIQILQNTIEAYQSRIGELLQFRKKQIDRQLSVAEKYQNQNKKLLGIIDQLYTTFDQEKYKLEETIKIKDELIAKITQERDQLINKSHGSQQRIDQLVKQHTKEIDQLKKELMILKDEVMQGSEQIQKQDNESQLKQTRYIYKSGNSQNNQTALRQITNLSQKNEQVLQKPNLRQSFSQTESQVGFIQIS